MADVLLIYPKTDQDVKNVNIFFPITLVSIAGSLMKKGFSVKIIDQRINSNYENKIKKELNKNPLCVGFSVATGRQIKHSLDMSVLIKKINPNLKIVWGGVHPTLSPIQTIQHPFIDIIVKGEGEETFVELVEALKKKKDLKEIKGISYKKNNKIYHNYRRPYMDLEKIPDFPFHLVNPRNYFIDIKTSKKTLLLFSSRGCQNNCKFCYNGSIHKSTWRSMSASKTFNLLQRAKELGATCVKFGDENFFYGRKRIQELYQITKKEKSDVNISTTSTLEDLRPFTKKFGEQLVKTNFLDIFIGIETISKKLQKYINKPINTNDLLKLNKNFNNLDIFLKYSFIMGFPNETKNDIQESLDVIKRLMAENKQSAHYINIFSPYYGTAIFNNSWKGYKNKPNPKKLEDWINYSWIIGRNPWVSKERMSYIKRVIHFMYFLNNKDFIYTNRHKNHLIYKLYQEIARVRCKMNFFNFAPEIKIKQFIPR